MNPQVSAITHGSCNNDELKTMTAALKRSENYEMNNAAE